MNNVKQKISTGLFVLAALSSVPASAMMMSIEETVTTGRETSSSGDFAGTSQTATFAQFDTLGGARTLTNVVISLTGLRPTSDTDPSQLTVTNNSGNIAGYSFLENLAVAVTGTGLAGAVTDTASITDFNNFADADGLADGETEIVISTVAEEASGASTNIVASSLGAYVGGGTVDFTVGFAWDLNEAASIAGGPGGALTFGAAGSGSDITIDPFELNGFARVELTYFFDDVVGVMSPASGALMSFAVLIIGGASRRRKVQA